MATHARIIVALVVLAGMTLLSGGPPPLSAHAPSAQQATPLALQSGPVLYEADWSTGLDEWTVSDDWVVVDGVLANVGSNATMELSASPPFRPDEMASYAVEADIRVVGELPEDACKNFGFGIVARAVELSAPEHGGYLAGFGDQGGCGSGEVSGIWAGSNRSDTSIKPLEGLEFDPGLDWHTYRLEVEGITIRLFIDGELMVENRDNLYLKGGQVGLWSDRVELDVRNFRVIAL